MAIESLKMYSSSRCKKRTYLCGSANYPVSWGNPGLAFAMVRCLDQSNVYDKKKLGLWRAQNVFF